MNRNFPPLSSVDKQSHTRQNAPNKTIVLICLLTITCFGNSFAQVNQPPIITISTPTDGEVFNSLSSVSIRTGAIDEDGIITKVEFFDEGNKIGEDLTFPFSFTFTPRPGEYKLTAKATDNVGATTTSDNVVITVLNRAPTVAITLPANGQTLNPLSFVTILASASDADGVVTKIEFFDGAVKIGADVTAPFVFGFIPSPGNHSLTAKATDSFGATTISAVVSITVLNQAPTVAITSPTNGQVFNPLSLVTITANATDADGTIAKVEFFDGQTKVGEDVAAPFSFAFTPLAGTHSLTAKAIDNSGATTTSAAVSITMLNQAPTVAITSPTDGQVFTHLSSVTITADAADTDGTIAKVEFFDGAIKVGEDLTAPFSTVFILGVLNPLLGNHSLTAKATDNLGATTTSAAVIIVENLTPSISITSPTNGQVFTPLSLVTITANATDADGTITKVEFFDGTTIVGEDVTAPFSFAFTPLVGTHSLTAKAIDNLGATTTSAAVSITILNQAPTVAITSPTDGQSFNSPAPISITVNAADVDGTIAKVEFFDGTVRLGEDLTSPFTFLFTPTAFVHSLTAKATDNLAATTTSSVVQIFVSFGNQAPTVAITSPANSQIINSPLITIHAEANDLDGTIAKVEFFDGFSKRGEDLTAPYSLTFSTVAGGHQLTVKATDNLGAITVSSPIVVQLVFQEPSINITSPTNGQVFNSLSPVTITANATDADGTITKVEFFDGGTSPANKIGEDVEAPFTVTFSPPDGIHALRANVTDNSGAVRFSSAVSITVGNQFFYCLYI